MKNKTKWDDRFYVECYTLARQGFTNDRIRGIIGVSKMGFVYWLRKKPALREALEKARQDRGGVKQFKEFVVGKLPEHLMVLWEEIMEIEDGNDEARLMALLDDKGKISKQYLFLHALVASNFNKTQACRTVGISLSTLTKWSRDKDFAELLVIMHEAKKDFVEGALMNLVAEGDRNAVIFANKSLNVDRGYGQKIQVEHSGNVEHQHQHLIDIDKLKLPLDVRMAILDAVQKQEKEQGLLEDHSDTIDVEYEEVA